METASEIKRAFDYLNSQEGTMQYLMWKTLLPRERVERIYGLGNPWPMFDSDNPPPELEYLEPALKGEIKTQDGLNISTTLNALADLRQMDIEEKEQKLAAYEAAVERGETPEPIPELKMSSEVHDHLEEVAKLSGENMETINDIYGAELARLQRLNQLIQRMVELKAKEENDKKGGCI